MKKIFTLIIFTYFIVSCNDIEKQIQGSWVVDQAYYDDEPVLWDLYTNSFDLKDNNICDLPPINRFSERSSEEVIGTWVTFKENGKSYIKINSTNSIFNRTFQIHNLRKVQDTVSWGYLLKMTISSDSLKMDCTKALYK